MNHETQLLPPDGQPLEAVYDALSDQRRHHVVDALGGREAPVILEELVAAVTARETAAAEDGGSTQAAGDIATTLHHCHLPKLAEAGVIDYDYERRAVTSNRADEFTQFLSTPGSEAQ